ncbi:hypothetical protein BCR44DRAFT_194177 [Catenaria anguillulae PL171]|uniref:Uncharacterized protein n=1 Tax=Catenaria anguillulae PL171 TaxID=765915 RepID=A0A1Y2HTC6_9FUNG|nr:hypothetical protein BCR44DRAFT_194177 [Catenaria anguillulae PL171]
MLVWSVSQTLPTSYDAAGNTAHNPVGYMFLAYGGSVIAWQLFWNFGMVPVALIALVGAAFSVLTIYSRYTSVPSIRLSLTRTHKLIHFLRFHTPESSATFRAPSRNAFYSLCTFHLACRPPGHSQVSSSPSFRWVSQPRTPTLLNQPLRLDPLSCALHTLRWPFTAATRFPQPCQHSRRCLFTWRIREMQS